MASIIAALDTLPPDVNRFTFTAEYLREQFVITNPAWVHAIFHVFAVFFAIALALTLFGLACKIKSGEFYLYRFSDGLVAPNAVVLYSLWISTFIMMMFANLIWSIWEDDHAQPPTGRLALFGLMWFAFWQAGFSYTISTISYTLKVGGRMNNLTEDASRWAQRRAKRDFKVYLVWLCDTLAVLLPVSHIVATWTIFIKSNQLFSNAVTTMRTVCSNLEALGPSYNPATFNIVTDLVPSLAPLTGMQDDLNEWIRLSGWGYGLLAFYCFLSLTIWAPFFFILGKHLRASMSSTTRSYSHGTGSGLSTNIVPTQARQQYRHLLLTTAAIFGKDFAYGGVALAVAVKPGYVLDPHYNIVAIVLSAGVFSIFGNVVAGMIAYRAYQSLRQASSTQTVLHISNPSLNGPTTSLHLRTQSQTQMEMGNIVRLNFDADLQSYGGVRTHAVKVEKEVYHYFEDDVTAKKDLQ